MYTTFKELKSTIKKALINAGLSDERAEILATTHSESSRDGVESHGLNRVPLFIKYIEEGKIDVDASIDLVNGMGAMEIYEGNLGIGIINAKEASSRSAELAREYGIGLVGVRNTNHWMRGGTYAWDLVDEGLMSIMWSTTEPVMPAWGSKEWSVGNNPMCIGVPYKDSPLVLDMAMSLYSYGRLQVTRLLGDRLPFDGGYNEDGELTDVPEDIEKTGRLLPMGYWKGSGLAIALEMFATMLTNGNNAGKLHGLDRGAGVGSTQIFIAVDPYVFFDREILEENVEEYINHLKTVERVDEDREVRYPGEGVMDRRQKSKETDQIKIDPGFWEKVQKLAK